MALPAARLVHRGGMKRRPRDDEPGAIHHVWSRGVARRSIYDCAEERRRFEELMLAVDERGWLKVLAYCLMSNHFHEMVYSPTGELSRGMRWLKQVHAQLFNRTHDRDGPLFSGRFGSRRIYTPDDRIRVVRYIDNNPVKAGLIERIEDWPFGSAYWYVRPSGPPWLHRRVVEEDIMRLSGRSHYEPADYLPRIDPKSMLAIEWWVESGMKPRSRRGETRDVEELARMGGSRLLRERALAADGVWEPLCLVPPGVLARAVDDAERRLGPWPFRPGSRRLCGWKVLKACLLRLVSGCDRAEAGEWVGIGEATVGRYQALLGRLLSSTQAMTQARAVLTAAGAETVRLLAVR